MANFLPAINFPPLNENDPTAPPHPLRAAMTSHTTVLDLSLGTNGMNARLDHTFVALFLALIPTLEHVRLRNLILEIPEYAPWSTIVPCLCRYGFLNVFRPEPRLPNTGCLMDNTYL